VERNVSYESEDEDEDDDELAVSKNAFQNESDVTSLKFHEAGFRHPMFPYVEKHSIFDDYGEGIVMSDLLSDNTPTFELKKEEPQKMEIEQDTEISTDKEMPTKCITSSILLNIKASIQFVDSQGKADGRSIKTILQNDVTPRKLILIHGSDAAKDSLVKHCEKTLKNICKLVLCPKNNELIDVSSDTNVFKVKLKESISDGLEFHKVGGYKLTYINCQMQLPNIEEGQTGAPLLTEITSGHVPGHRAVFIGDLKLNDFKQLLIHSGFKAELFGGVLLVGDGNVALRKEEVDGTSGIKLEGVISEEYFKIRDILYHQFVVL